MKCSFVYLFKVCSALAATGILAPLESLLKTKQSLPMIKVALYILGNLLTCLHRSTASEVRPHVGPSNSHCNAKRSESRSKIPVNRHLSMTQRICVDPHNSALSQPSERCGSPMASKT